MSGVLGGFDRFFSASLLPYTNCICLGFRVQGLGFRVGGLGFRIRDFGKCARGLVGTIGECMIWECIPFFPTLRDLDLGLGLGIWEFRVVGV